MDRSASIPAAIAANLAAVRARIAAACAQSARDAADVSLIAVTKYAEHPWVRALLDAGHFRFGESRPQQLTQRAGEFNDERIEWHLIGHLQRNKVRPVLGVADVIHSVDSVRLLERIDLLAEETGVTPKLLLEVNVSGEPAKDGFSTKELEAAWSRIEKFQHIELRGLMTMAPAVSDPTEARPFFAKLREIRDAALLPLPELSMGMSNDFEQAILEGATMIRVGSRLFEGAQS